MSKDKGTPEYGKQYCLVGGKDTKSIAKGNTWAESEVKHSVEIVDHHLTNIYLDWYLTGPVPVNQNAKASAIMKTKGKEEDNHV